MATTMPKGSGRFDSSDTLALDWRGLYQEHAPRLRRIAERRVGSTQAEDVVQDAFMRAFRNRASLDPARPIGAWLSSITLYSSTDALRRRSARPEVLVDEEGEPAATGSSVEDDFENAVRRLGIEAAFESLNHRQRRVLKRLEVDGWTQEEVAAVEHISPEAVKSLAARARRTFRESYAAFAERMGVFGGAAVGPAIWRLRSRFQRFQGFAGDHVGAFGVAAATVTVVAIAAVPSTRPMPTRAEEAPSTTTSEADGVQGSESGGAPSTSTPTIHVQPSAIAVSYSTPSGAEPQTQAEVDAANGPSTTEVRASAEVGKKGSGASIRITGGTNGPDGDRETIAGVNVHDCSANSISRTACTVIVTVDEASSDS